MRPNLTLRKSTLSDTMRNVLVSNGVACRVLSATGLSLSVPLAAPALLSEAVLLHHESILGPLPGAVSIYLENRSRLGRASWYVGKYLFVGNTSHVAGLHKLFSSRNFIGGILVLFCFPSSSSQRAVGKLRVPKNIVPNRRDTKKTPNVTKKLT